jgi:pSer/pThr/pTyr-binding forkhead associated (FHA) protein
MRLTPFEHPSADPQDTAEERSACRYWLEIRRGAARQRLRPVRGPVYLIGASADCDLVLGDPQFPPVHAYLRVRDDRVLLRYLGAGPEITVDGRPVEAAELLHGDRLRTGPFEFRLLATDGPQRPEGAYEEAKRRSARLPRRANESPLHLVRALVRDVRTMLNAARTAEATPADRREAA